MFEGLHTHFQEEMQQEVKVIETAILQGNTKDIAEYRYLVGKRQGLLIALERNKELISLALMGAERD